MSYPAFDLKSEFERQVEILLKKGYPKAAGMTRGQFLAMVKPLARKAKNLKSPKLDLEKGFLPFVIVIGGSLVPAEKAMVQVKRGGKKGAVKLFPRLPEDFMPLKGIKLPKKPVYLLADIERGAEYRKMAPSAALKKIYARKRFPLTIDEGVAIVTHYPEFLMKNHCFSLLASRCPADKRVPAIWINAAKQPNLGWCWDGNPHSWLGSASCKARL